MEHCWEQNKHGAGYAIYQPDKETWRYRKGFMKYKHFLKAFKQEKVTADTCYILHFRIKSAGEIVKAQTHPFVLSRDYRNMSKLSSKGEKSLIFHNGTCGRGDGGSSDTMAFTKKFIAPLMEYEKKDKAMEKILSHLLTETHDRWLITDGNSISRWGTWHEHEGAKFSNLIWKPYRQVKPIKPVYPQTKPAGYVPPSSSIQTGTGETRSWNNNSTDMPGYMPGCLVERTGELHPDGTVTWDKDETTPSDEIISMCPYCYEDKHLVDSPFQGMGDTMCERCGACFDDGTDVVIIHDHELLKSYEERLKASRVGEI
jgi:hypothetical protein